MFMIDAHLLFLDWCQPESGYQVCRLGQSMALAGDIAAALQLGHLQIVVTWAKGQSSSLHSWFRNVNSWQAPSRPAPLCPAGFASRTSCLLTNLKGNIYLKKQTVLGSWANAGRSFCTISLGSRQTPNEHSHFTEGTTRAFIHSCKNDWMTTSKVAHWENILAAKPDDRSLSPRYCMVEEENQSWKLSSDCHTCTMACTHKQTSQPPSVNK